MFHNTHPLGPATGFERTDMPTTRMDDRARDFADTETSDAATLSPSLLRDLKRFADEPAAADLLAVLAASVRHGKPLSLSLDLDGRAVDLTLHPLRQVYYSALDLCALGDEALSRIRLLRVEPDQDPASLLAGRTHIGSLRPLLWHLAMRGAHTGLLPEIAGPVRCRMALGNALSGLPIDGSRKRLIQRMRLAPVALDDLLSDTILGRAAVERLWNALYLQSALMVTRAFSQ